MFLFLVSEMENNIYRVSQKNVHLAKKGEQLTNEHFFGTPGTYIEYQLVYDIFNGGF